MKWVTRPGNRYTTECDTVIRNKEDSSYDVNFRMTVFHFPDANPHERYRGHIYLNGEIYQCYEPTEEATKAAIETRVRVILNELLQSLPR